ncbi:UNVERIFIED_CONTAM: hypothetical protein Sradi_7244700 [Sesamum radiatum]|uniref:DUF4283 domain-containing protein n=1 Tax=Sesamum radiatum TaxID=300843 RepID=A0AAW2ILX7_SESRA
MVDECDEDGGYGAVSAAPTKSPKDEARRVIRGSTTAQAVLSRAAPTSGSEEPHCIMSHGARGSTAAHGLAPPSGSAEPQNVSHGATKLSLSAEACDDSTDGKSKAVQAAQAALGSIAAPPSGFTEPKAHGAPHRPLAAASTAEPSLVAKSPQQLAVLPMPTPLTATTERFYRTCNSHRPLNLVSDRTAVSPPDAGWFSFLRPAGHGSCFLAAVGSGGAATASRCPTACSAGQTASTANCYSDDLLGSAVCEVKATSNGFFFFQFENVAAMEEVIEGGPWLYLGQPIVLQKWEPGMVLRKLKHTEVPIWIKLRHLPVELWTTEGLSTVASGIGRPLYPDAITRACTRLDFARVCVMLNVNSKLPKHVVIMMPNELGGESACKVDVEYEWIPHKCTGCLSLGHSTKECPISKPTKPAVSIYVRKSTPTIPVAPELKLMEKVHAPQVSEEIHHQPETDRVGDERPEHGRDKGKDIVLFNAFDLLRETDDDADGLSRGPNKSNPSDISPC